MADLLAVLPASIDDARLGPVAFRDERQNLEEHVRVPTLPPSAMGHAHSVHILMPIIITAAVRAMHTSRLLLDKEPDEADEEVGLPQTLACPEVVPRDAIFEAAKRKETYNDDETTPPSLLETCGDVFDDGWEKDVGDDSWKEIPLSIRLGYWIHRVPVYRSGFKPDP